MSIAHIGPGRHTDLNQGRWLPATERQLACGRGQRKTELASRPAGREGRRADVKSGVGPPRAGAGANARTQAQHRRTLVGRRPAFETAAGPGVAQQQQQQQQQQHRRHFGAGWAGRGAPLEHRKMCKIV